MSAPVPFDTAHRPYPLPARSWSLHMTWYDLAFLHWPVPAETLRATLPEGLELDTFEGRAWLGVVPFGMSNIHPRGWPRVPGASAFLEMNLRTYVTRGEWTGVWFYSLDAAHRLAVRAARRTFHLPYMDARMALDRHDGWIDYAGKRTHRGEPGGEFRARYRPVSGVRTTRPGSIEHWLTERYCLYSADRSGRLHRGHVHHAPWPLQDAEVEIEVNTLGNPPGIELPGAPALAHFSRSLDVVGWTLEEAL